MESYLLRRFQACAFVVAVIASRTGYAQPSQMDKQAVSDERPQVLGPVATRRHELKISIAAGDWAQRVPSIASAASQGIGFSASLEYDRRNASRSWQGALLFGKTTMHPSDGSANSSDLGFEAELSVARLWHVRERPLGWQLGIGAQIDATVNANVHQFGAPFNASDDLFGFAVLAASPSLQMNYVRNRSSFGVNVSAPLVALGDFPYSDANAQGSLSLRPMTVNSYRAIVQHLSWRKTAGRSAVEFAHKLSYRRVSRHDTRTYVRQELSIAMIFPFGSVVK